MKNSRREFGKWMVRGGILVPFVAPIRSAIQIISPRGFPQAAAGGGGGSSCPADGAYDIGVPAQNDDEDTVGNVAERIYIGQMDYVQSGTKDVCKVGFYFGAITGTVSGKGYRVSIWTQTGSNLNTQVGTHSDELTGITTTGWKYFSWSGTKPNLVNGTTYAIACATYTAGTTTLAAADASNFVKIWADSPSSISGNAGGWTSAGGNEVDSVSVDRCMELYWYD